MSLSTPGSLKSAQAQSIELRRFRLKDSGDERFRVATSIERKELVEIKPEKTALRWSG